MLDIWPLVVLVRRRFFLVSFMNHSHEVVVVFSLLASDYKIKCLINLCWHIGAVLVLHGRFPFNSSVLFIDILTNVSCSSFDIFPHFSLTE